MPDQIEQAESQSLDGKHLGKRDSLKPVKRPLRRILVYLTALLVLVTVPLFLYVQGLIPFDFDPLALLNSGTGNDITAIEDPVMVPPANVLTLTDPSFIALQDKADQLENRLEDQGRILDSLVNRLDGLTESLEQAIEVLGNEIEEATSVSSPGEQQITQLTERQVYLENRLLAINQDIAGELATVNAGQDALVGSLSLVKQQLARHNDLISDLGSDLYLLSRYGYGQPNQEHYYLSSGNEGESEPDEQEETRREPIKRGDYRVGDWIHGHGEVLSIHRTQEGDYLTTENGTVFAPDPEGEGPGS